MRLMLAHYLFVFFIRLMKQCQFEMIHQRMKSLRDYHKKRDFSKTSEPEKDDKKESGHLFCIQKHASTYLHYDFRIELGGVLKSFAVPKGPSCDPHIKRLAIEVEDHPLSYGVFEGVIPQGQYGGGTVMLWDKGAWESLDADAVSAYQKGHLRMILEGKKLKGRWDLIRLKNKKQWFLIKHQDDHAKDQADYDVTEALDKSVLSHRTINEIANALIFVKKASEVPAAITHPHKILYPEDQITKEDLLAYYESISDYILPFIVFRPLTLLRCPSSYTHCFYQRHYNKTTPNALHAIDIFKKEDDTDQPYIYLKDKAGLLSLVQMDVLEIHPWGSQLPHLEKPDMITIDLDPGEGVPWAGVVAAAQDIRAYLTSFALMSFVKATGGKGLHIVIPVEPLNDWEVVHSFVHTLVQTLEKTKPEQYVSSMKKSKRVGKIFVDYFRNQLAATAIAAYSTRARCHAPVAVPLAWDELSADREDTIFTIKTLPQRLATLKKDPWQDFWQIKQCLSLNNSPQ